MRNLTTPLALLALFLLVAIGCNKETATDGNGANDGNGAIDGSKYLLGTEPEGAVEVIKARKTVKDGDEVVVVGRIGGERDPWLKGKAVFMITDSSLKPCNELEGDDCKTPWDYCCAPDLGTSRATVWVVDEQGDVLKAGAKDLLNLKELQTVVVRGKAKWIDGENLNIHATGVYVKQ